MTRVIHTADTHLGYRQYHAPERREDFLDAFRQVAEDAVDEGADAVVHAGDLFHDRRPDLGDLMGALSVLRRLDDAGIPFLAVVGNHETKRDAQWLDLFESLGLAARLGDEPVEVGDVAFYGLDFVPRARRDDLEYDFEPPDADRAALVAHGPFAPLVPDVRTDVWEIETVLGESNVDFDAVLLGDEHAADTARVDGTWVTYPGSTERVSADERAERGYNIVEFRDDGDGHGGDGDVRITRRGLDTRAFAFVEVELDEGEGAERVRERVGQHDLEDAVAVVTIDGAGDPVTPAAVEEFARERGALVARVTDRREATEEHEAEVSFADPDEAVRERVRELGLSEAARDLDETIRASKVADSNVRGAVEERVRELVDGDPAAFEPAPEDEDERGAATDEPTSDAVGVADADTVDTVDTDDAAEDAEDAEAGGDTVGTGGEGTAGEEGTADGDETTDGDGTAGNEETAGKRETDSDDGSDADSDGGSDGPERIPAAGASRPGSAEPDGSDATEGGVGDADSDGEDDGKGESEPGVDSETADGTGGQASMEEYL